MSDDTRFLSAASKRALAYTQGPEWYCEFKEHDLQGDFAYEEGVIRRDPSALIKVDGVFHCWYTRGEGASAGFGTGDESLKVFPWDQCEVWHATSPDGETWKEEGLAVGRGPKGAYDERSVFTPEILAHGGKYYLVYQTVESPYTNRVCEHVSMAVADSPFGPWEKVDGPVLSPAQDGQWRGDEDNRFHVHSKGSFDSHKTHDPCILPFQGKFYLYYKGERMGEELTYGGREIAWGVAIADHPTGPYEKSPYNPVSNSGHEVCVWPYRGGIAGLLTTDGVERNTFQYAEDGINFEIKAHIKGGPEAIGLWRGDDPDGHPLNSVRWGLCHKYGPDWKWQYIRGFTSHVPVHA
ncbi:glycoside hydrolase family 117 protein [Phycisphaera mikurensis]|uniref:Glycosyl hydrolase n=1 Tax=Phycisphaera mikurensis (strain NBRC 102666 / KCTC 22515 / FYK2301M01) TaxID=1142394 RepID=I0IHH2_PHYMF|nr:family 43 glycosylhydrolase [Phycisphaera mikurensis]MBB6440957.1 hypothetical protein [Phycisphaera mikurensis]BAM04710.1 hypothetical protein PSMK_25510 [Phycisphaera mikurensis NBRC 102666]